MSKNLEANGPVEDKSAERSFGEVLVELKEAFASESVDRRLSAAMDCVDYRTSEIAALLAEQLERDPSVFVRATLVKALGATDDGTHVDCVVRKLWDADDRVRANTLEALGLYDRAPEVASCVLALRKDASERVRANVSKYMEDVDSTMRAQALEIMLVDPRESLRLGALSLTLELIDGDDTAVGLDDATLVSLVDALKTVSQYKVRQAALAVLKSLVAAGVEEARDALGLDDDGPQDEPGAIAAVSAPVESEKGSSALSSADPNERVREIARLLEEGGDAALATLREHSDTETDPMVLKNTLVALGMLGGSAERDLLIAHLTDGPIATRLAAVDALAELDDSDSLDALEAFLGHKDGRLRAAAAAALCDCGRLDAGEFLHGLVNSGGQDDLLCALMTIRCMPQNPRVFHDLLMEIHDTSDQPRIMSYAQEVERDLQRRGLFSAAHLTDPDQRVDTLLADSVLRRMQIAALVLCCIIASLMWARPPTVAPIERRLLSRARSETEVIALIVAALDLGQNELAERVLAAALPRLARAPRMDLLARTALGRGNLRPSLQALAERETSRVLSPVFQYLLEHERFDEAKALLIKNPRNRDCVKCARSFVERLERADDARGAVGFLRALEGAGLKSPLLAARLTLLEKATQN